MAPPDYIRERIRVREERAARFHRREPLLWLTLLVVDLPLAIIYRLGTGRRS